MDVAMFATPNRFASLGVIHIRPSGSRERSTAIHDTQDRRLMGGAASLAMTAALVAVSRRRGCPEGGGGQGSKNK
jgi:uncharacterized membrane-anchored protein